MPEEVKYLTVQDIARQLQVTELTVRRWIDSGQLPAIKLAGGRFRIHPKDFQDFLDKQRQQP